MPNGGPDNCGMCAFNRVNGGRWIIPEEMQTVAGFCTIRNQQILSPHWTYCKNWHTRSTEPAGPIYSSFYENGYRRIPWVGKTSPETEVEALCSVCTNHVNSGLRITLGDEVFGFCGHEHYLKWWKDTLERRLEWTRAAGERAYDLMYDVISPTRAAGHYSDAKDLFAEAIFIAGQLELPEVKAQLEARLQHIKDVFRHQF